jgi:hypothetical protein
VLLADGESNLREQAVELDLQHATDQLIAAADLAKIAAPCLDLSALQICRNQAIDLALGNTMMAAGSFYRLEFVAIDPLLQAWDS